jgi:hypothetical protein
VPTLIDVIGIAAAVATLVAWLAFVIQYVRLPWHIRWDIKPYPSSWIEMQRAFGHPEWLDAKGLAVRGSAQRFLKITAMGFMVVVMSIVVRMYVDV